MEHMLEDNIVCPYCGWENKDSWEFDEDDAVVTCGECEKEFNVSKDISVTYSTSRIKCENGEHNYKLDHYFVSKRKHVEGLMFVDLPEFEWTYYRIMYCDVCDDRHYEPITKDEYSANLNNAI